MMFPLFFLVLGLFFGSFLSVVLFRFPDFKSMGISRSKCPNCCREIAWFDLIPLFSYIFLFGRCRRCQARVSLIYPAIEILTGTLFFLFAWKIGQQWLLLPYLLLTMVSVLIFFYDLIHLEIPDLFSWSFLILALISVLLAPHFSIPNILYGGLIGGGFLAILVFGSREKLMGSGDIFIGLSYGLLLGLVKSLLFLLLSFSLGAIIGLALIAFNRKKLKSEIAFAPFLIIAGSIAIIWGDKIVNWYLSLL